MGHALVSDFEKGSTYVWADRELEIAHPDQVILESDPYRRLAFTFHTFVPELSELGLDEETIAKAAAERRSKVSFDIETADDDQVKLTVVHDDFGPESTVRELISGGWPWKLSNLKIGAGSNHDGHARDRRPVDVAGTDRCATSPGEGAHPRR